MAVHIDKKLLGTVARTGNFRTYDNPENQRRELFRGAWKVGYIDARDLSTHLAAVNLWSIEVPFIAGQWINVADTSSQLPL